MYVCIITWVHIDVHVHNYICVCTHTYMYIVNVCSMYMYMYIHNYTYVCMLTTDSSDWCRYASSRCPHEPYLPLSTTGTYILHINLYTCILSHKLYRNYMYMYMYLKATINSLTTLVHLVGTDFSVFNTTRVY